MSVFEFGGKQTHLTGYLEGIRAVLFFTSKFSVFPGRQSAAGAKKTSRNISKLIPGDGEEKSRIFLEEGKEFDAK